MLNNVVSSTFTFFSLDGSPILNVKHIVLDDLGRVSSIIYLNDNDEELELSSSEFTYTNLILHIPGVDHLAYCGDKLFLARFRECPKEYTLNFGWHENVSNQKIFSWYLEEYDAKGELIANKTLYYDDLVRVIAVKNVKFGISDIEAKEVLS